MHRPKERKAGQELSRKQWRRLKKIRYDRNDLATTSADVLFSYTNQLEKKIKEGPIDDEYIKNSRKRPWRELSPNNDTAHMIPSQVRLYEHIAQVVNMFDFPRAEWEDWLNPIRDKYKAFYAILLMALTARTHDTRVKHTIRKLIHELRRNGMDPKSMLVRFRADTYENSVRKLDKIVKMTKFASYLIQIALVCYLLDEVPSTYTSLTCLTGVGPKMADAVMYAAHRKITGIPCDVHMIKMFPALGWCPREETDDDGSKVAEYVMGWMPEDHWLNLNYTFAGLGQLLNSKKKNKVKDCLLNSMAEDWMEVPIKDLLKEYNL